MNRSNHKHIYVIDLFAHSLRSLATFAFNPYNSANAHNLQKWIALIINNLSTKTYGNTGKKPAKQEMKNKTNMTSKRQTSKSTVGK
jgi:hypothetical protein